MRRVFHESRTDALGLGTGKIKEQNWYGPNGMQHLRTKAKPEQSIPTFAETVELLMKVRLRFLDVGLSLEPNFDRARSQRTATPRSMWM